MGVSSDKIARHMRTQHRILEPLFALVDRPSWWVVVGTASASVDSDDESLSRQLRAEEIKTAAREVLEHLSKLLFLHDAY